ncbi:MAG: DUF362 domain-containing protein [bacterium]|nr:DUF362 domain-containing protein [bacterium]
MKDRLIANRRDFLKVTGTLGAGVVLGTPAAWAESGKDGKPATNIAEILEIPRTKSSIPGPYPGRLVEVYDEAAMPEGEPAADVVKDMFERGIKKLTGKSMKSSFKKLFSKRDIVGIKVNPVGAGLINTRLELVDAVIDWLTDNGMKKRNIIIWDRFGDMLADSGYTEERFPGVGIASLQKMDMAAFGEGASQSGWRNDDGTHRNEVDFDPDVFYYADVEAMQEETYRHQHVHNGKRSHFGKLVTQKLTKIINLPVFKNTGNGISMATKNLGYGVISNTGRLHQPLFFDVCTEVLAFPAVRDKLVLNVIDGLRGQYDGGPMPAADFTWEYNRLFFATDPIALDRACHDLMVAKRKEMGVQVNEHPMFTDYLHYAERLGLGIGDPAKIEHLKA